jgi:hypothetical protein
MKQFFRTIKCGVLGAFLLLGIAAPLTFTSCYENEHPEINIDFVSDYSGIIDAIKKLDGALADKLALIDASIQAGTLANTQALDLVKAAINSSATTLAEKLAAVESALSAQTLSLETKLALIETALNEGFADVAEAQDLMTAAIESLEGTMDEKLAAVEEALNNQTLSLETKLDLIDATLEAGFASLKEGQDMLAEALASIDTTLQTRLDAVAEVIDAQTVELSAKLALIDATIKEGFANEAEALDLIKKAIATMDGNMQTKLAALKKAVDDQTTSLSTKLEAINSAIEEGFIAEAEALDLMTQAIQTMDENLQDKLAAIKRVIKKQTLSIESQFALLLTALDDAFGEEGTITDALAAIQEALDGEDGIADVLDAINETLGDAFDAEEGIPALLSAIEEALTDANYTENLDEIAEILNAILEALGGTPVQEPDSPTNPTGQIGDYDYVDLGIGIVFATVNIGAQTPEAVGSYFAWGETATKDEYTEANYEFRGGPGHDEKYKEGPNDPHTLLAEDDAASVIWGETWYTPTAEDWAKLLEAEDFEWVAVDGGYKVVSKIEGFEGNYIILPFYKYWSSDLYIHPEPPAPAPGERNKLAQILNVASDIIESYRHTRYLGLAIHPVAPKPQD